MSAYDDLSEKFLKINFNEMTDIELCKWLRKQTNISLSDSLRIAKIIRQAYNLGVIRNEVVNK